METRRDTSALPTNVVEVGGEDSGCFMIEKKEVKDNETKVKNTEADFCFECIEKDRNKSVLSSLIGEEGFLKSTLDYLKKVTKKTRKKVQAQTVIQGDAVTKICSPEKSLKAIIKNFNRTCPSPYKNNFEKFLKTAYCESCERGIAPEIMMSIMSIESAGRCKAVGSSANERSVGLFQVNSRVHSCRNQQGEVYKKRTKANLKCFKDPINNMNSSLDILRCSYDSVNPGDSPTSECKSLASTKGFRKR